MKTFDAFFPALLSQRKTRAFIFSTTVKQHRGRIQEGGDKKEKVRVYRDREAENS